MQACERLCAIIENRTWPSSAPCIRRQQLKLDKLWLAFGVGKHFRYLPVQETVNSLNPDKSVVLPFFHALTGCDTVSAFSTRGKKVHMCYVWPITTNVNKI